MDKIAAVLSKESKAKTIWKSTAAIHDQTAAVMGSFRRFTTDHVRMHGYMVIPKDK